MTLEQGIQHWKEVAEEYEAHGIVKECYECAKEYRRLAEWLEDYKELKEATQWIPCSERLPEVGEPVLIYEPYNEEMVVASLDCDKIGFSNDDYWYGLRNVPFWMPLPEKPKGEKNERQNQIRT